MNTLEAEVAALETDLAAAKAKLQRVEPKAASRAPMDTPTKGGRRIVASSRPDSVGADEEAGEPEKKNPERVIGEMLRAFAESEAGQALQQWGTRPAPLESTGP